MATATLSDCSSAPDFAVRSCSLPDILSHSAQSRGKIRSYFTFYLLFFLNHLLKSHCFSGITKMTFKSKHLPTRPIFFLYCIGPCFFMFCIWITLLHVYLLEIETVESENFRVRK